MTVNHCVLTDIIFAWTAGQRVNRTVSPSSFIWRLQTSNYTAKLPITYDGWVPGEPRDIEQFCLALNQYANYFWIDWSCHDLFYSVCEMDIV